MTRYFVNKGEQVVGIDLAKPYEDFPTNLFTFHKCDLTDRDAVLRAFGKFSPKNVIHLAFVTHRKDIYEEFWQFIPDDNETFTKFIVADHERRANSKLYVES